MMGKRATRNLYGKCIRCDRILGQTEYEVDTGNLCRECRKITINADYEGEK